MKHELQKPLTWQGPGLPFSHTLELEPLPEIPVKQRHNPVELALTAYGTDSLSAKLEMQRQLGELIRRLEIASFNMECDIAGEMQQLAGR